MSHKVTVFKSINSEIPLYFDVLDVLGSIKRGKNKKIIEEIRNEKDKEKRDRLKRQLTGICFSGEFRKRLNNELVEHSGLICIDFDNFPNRKTLDLWFNKIKSDKYCFALFISPSGNGLKLLMRIPRCKTNDEHNLRFDAISEYFFDCAYFDKNGKGSVRLCYESYDPDIYINTESIVFPHIKKAEPKEITRLDSIKLAFDTDSTEIFSKLIVWFESKYNLRKGTRNENLFYFVSACRDYGIPEASAIILISNYASSAAEDFPSIQDEIPIIVRSAYNKPSAGKTMKIIPMQSSASEQDNSIDCSDFNFEEEKQEEYKFVEEEDVDEKIPTQYIFWKWTGITNKIDFLKLKQFLQENGFYRYELNEKDFLFIRVIDNTIQEVDVRHIKDFLLKCLESWDQTDIYNMIAENTKLKKEYLNYLDPLKIEWNKDTKDCGWVYFKNIAVKVCANKIELVEYIDLDGFIWRSQKLNRNFTLINESKSYATDFAKFISNVCNSNEGRINSFRSAIGYLMHRYKSKSTVKATIFNDEVMSDDAMGGSGKGLTIQIISTVRNVVLIPGADFDTGKDFAWQRIGHDTDIVVIDDIERNFKMKKLFTFLTDGWPIRKLYQNEIFMKPEDSPKIAITTNYTLKGETDSYARRKFELELYPYYNKNHQPIDDFKKEFISEWNDYEKNVCDNYLIYCFKHFLTNGLIEPHYVNLKYKKLITNTSVDFAAFAESYLLDNHKYHKKEIHKLFREENGLSQFDYPSQKVFTAWMEYWGTYNGMTFNSRFGAGGAHFTYGAGKIEWRTPTNLIF